MSGRERYTHAHPLTKWAQGLLQDYGSSALAEDEFREFNDVLCRATEAAKDVEEARDCLRAACETVVKEMERYYRDGSHPDLSPILRACREALEATA
jgi:hypothetical protein